jgi:hypothetical protein
MSSYLVAVVIATVALLLLIVFLLRAAMAVRRVGGLAAAYRRELTAQAALVKQRLGSLLAEVATRRGRTRTMR